MNQDLIEFVDRQFDFLCRQQGVGFLRQLRRWYLTLQQEPRIAALLWDLRQEAEALVKRHHQWDDEVVQQLVEMRGQLATLVPEVDDSGMPCPKEETPRWHSSLTRFDQLVSQGHQNQARNINLTGTEYASQARELLRILQAKLPVASSAIAQAPGDARRSEIEKLGGRLSRLSRQHEHRHREFVNDVLTSAGVALLQILRFIRNMNPEPGLDASHHKSEGFLIGEIDGNTVRRLLYETGPGHGGRELNESTDKHASSLRADAERVHEELRLRIGTRRSLLALMHRFRARCEWHDRTRLHELARKSSTPEDDLAAELARWLFDQGLCPITKPLTGRLQPDLLDPSAPSRLYVEAKRYRSPARSYLKRGIWQLYDTVMGLKGTPYEVHEAFFVVFRESGPRYVFPESVRGEGWTVFPLLVDIAPTSESGSRQQHQPREITEQEFAAALLGEGLSDGDPDEVHVGAA